MTRADLDFQRENNTTGVGKNAPNPKKGRRCAAPIWICVLGFVGALLVGALVWKVLNDRAWDQARDSYIGAVAVEEKTFKGLDERVVQAEGLSVDCVAKVAQAGLCEELTGVLKEAKSLGILKGIGDVEEAAREELDKATLEVQANTKMLMEVKTKLKVRIDEVSQSMKAKELADAKAGLESAVGAAEAQVSSVEALLSASEGKVVDEGARQAASSALGEVKGLLEKAKSSGEADAAKLKEFATNLADKTGALATAHAALQASHEAWQQAQAAAASAAQANRQNPRAGSGDSVGSGRASQTHKPARRGNTGGASRPAQGTTGGSSSKTSNSGGGSGNSGGSTGGWVETGNSGGSFCGDEFGNSWDC